MVIDTSALMAVLFNEPSGPKIAEILQSSSSELRMSTVNLTELLILLEDRQPQLFAEMRSEILSSSIRFVPPLIEHSELAAKARLKFPLNLGDCFAYALSKIEDSPILTLNPDFKKTDCSLVPIR